MTMLYIGHYDAGSTSGMRGEYLKEILQPDKYKVVNIDIPLKATSRLFRSFGWRFKMGPLINNINDFIVEILQNNWKYDLVWVDKGVFVQPCVIQKLKKHSGKLIHFTPDPAFAYHRSALFFSALQQYDVCVTTKSFEIEEYKKRGANKLITCTQGFHQDIHKPYFAFEEKKGFVFIGHHEENREALIAKLIEKNIDVTLAGVKWGRFVYSRKNKKNLHYLGYGVFAENYAKTISGALIGIGFLSKIVPELHTTRTFEIPACGTALITEKNEEIRDIFNDDEVIYFDNEHDFIEKAGYGLAHPDWLNAISEKGYKKVTEGGYDYKSILGKILSQIEG